MIDFIVNAKQKDVLFHFPENIKEITPEYLKDVTSNITIADNYSLVGIIYHETLSSIILAYKQRKKDIKAGVIPVFVKSGKTDNEFIQNIKPTEKIIITGTQLGLGIHVNAPKNKLNLDYFMNLAVDDSQAFNKALECKKEALFIEFKLVPNCDIVGAYAHNDASYNNPFVEVIDK